MSDKLAYGVPEAAAALCLSRATLYRLIRRGELTTFNVVGRTLISRSVLETFVDRMATG